MRNPLRRVPELPAKPDAEDQDPEDLIGDETDDPFGDVEGD